MGPHHNLHVFGCDRTNCEPGSFKRFAVLPGRLVQDTRQGGGQGRNYLQHRTSRPHCHATDPFLDEQKAKREGRTLEDVAAESSASIPVGRMAHPEYGDVVAFLASTRASFVTGSIFVSTAE